MRKILGWLMLAGLVGAAAVVLVETAAAQSSRPAAFAIGTATPGPTSPLVWTPGTPGNINPYGYSYNNGNGGRGTGMWGQGAAGGNAGSGWGMGMRDQGGTAGNGSNCCGGNGGTGWGMGMGMGRGWRGSPTSLPAFPPTAGPPATPTPISYSADVQSIFNARCIVCHGGTQGLYLTDYASVLAGGRHGPVIVPGDPAQSRLIQYVRQGYMPYGGRPLSAAEVQTLVNWVAAGAPNN